MPRALEDAFSDIVRKARFGLGVEAGDVAERSELALDLVTSLEAGSVKPSAEQVRRLAPVLRLGPTALWSIVEGWVPPEPLDTGPFTVQTFRFEPMDSNGYLVTGPGIARALLVDPGGRPQELIAACGKAGGLDAILITHSHGDHIGAMHEVITKFPDAVVIGHQMALDRLDLPGTAERRGITRDTVLQVSEAELNVLVALGHSDDGAMFRLGSCVFTGDTLFAGSLGRSAQGPATYDALLHSAKRLLSLPPHTTLLPGHGPMTTVELESVHNPFLVLS